MLDEGEKIDEEPDPNSIKKEFKKNYEKIITEFRSHSPDRKSRYLHKI